MIFKCFCSLHLFFEIKNIYNKREKILQNEINNVKLYCLSRTIQYVYFYEINCNKINFYWYRAPNYYVYNKCIVQLFLCVILFTTFEKCFHFMFKNDFFSIVFLNHKKFVPFIRDDFFK